ncbi:hypothetical protein BDP67DRAFT_562732 [Colletotrichum lupini]|nr:hypothetical protein BDP67DRAFT_562732 [Colletotrichum lupini]
MADALSFFVLCVCVCLVLGRQVGNSSVDGSLAGRLRMERVVRSNKRAEVGQCDKSKREANISRECGPKGAGVCFQSRSRGRILEVGAPNVMSWEWNATPYAASSSTLARVSGTAACGGHSEARRMTPAGCSGVSELEGPRPKCGHSPNRTLLLTESVGPEDTILIENRER